MTRSDFCQTIASVVVLLHWTGSSAIAWDGTPHVDDAYGFRLQEIPEMPYRAVDRDKPLHIEHDGLGVYVSHHPSSRWDDLVFPILEIFEEGNSAISAAFSDSQTITGNAWIAVERLDPHTLRPQVILTRYDGGGAQCCFQTSIFTVDEHGWKRIELPYQYSDVHYRITDIDGDGRLELVGLDSEFLAANRHRSIENGIPVRAYALEDGQMSDVSELLNAQRTKATDR